MQNTQDLDSLHLILFDEMEVSWNSRALLKHA